MRGENQMEKLKIKTVRSLTNYFRGPNGLDLGKINLLLIKVDLDSERKIKLKPHCPSSPPHPTLSPDSASLLHPQLLSLFSLSGIEGQGMGAMGRTERLLPPDAFPLLHRRPLHGLQLPSGHTRLLLCGVCRSHTEPLLERLQPFLLLRPWGSHCSLTLLPSLPGSALPLHKHAQLCPEAGLLWNRPCPAGGSALLTEAPQPPLPAPTPCTSIKALEPELGF